MEKIKVTAINGGWTLWGYPMSKLCRNNDKLDEKVWKGMDFAQNYYQGFGVKVI